VKINTVIYLVIQEYYKYLFPLLVRKI